MDLGDLLKLLIPAAIFIVSVLFGSNSKRKNTTNEQTAKDDLLDLLLQENNENFESQYKYRYLKDFPIDGQPINKNEPKPEQSADNSAKGKQTTVTPQSENITEIEPDTETETTSPAFDLRSAIISSAIIERKY